MNERKIARRILLAKVGLDGHDRGIKVVARGLRDAGLHVIYSGLWQSVDAVAQAAQDEDVDWLGVSILNGAHMSLVPALLEALRQRDLTHIGVIVGGIIPPDDQEKLKQLGVLACFGPGTSIDSIVEFLL
ncbi:MAG: cobalamin B12-binding domain-containing protein [Planctomycetia bacterium]|nr:cobalamin B12-binding domain-containing protein [Planctomycetia bacterium]